MNHAEISAGFYISLCSILPAGIILMILWGKKILRPVLAPVETRHAKTGSFSINEIAMRVFIFMIPGFLVLILFSVPVFFFSHLLKQENHCVQIIRVNKMTPEKDRRNKFLLERAKWLDVDELFERAKNESDDDR